MYVLYFAIVLIKKCLVAFLGSKSYFSTILLSTQKMQFK